MVNCRLWLWGQRCIWGGESLGAPEFGIIYSCRRFRVFESTGLEDWGKAKNSGQDMGAPEFGSWGVWTR